MSKKDKAKFRKRIKAEILKEMAEAQQVVKTPNQKAVPLPAVAPLAPPKTPTPSTTLPAETAATSSEPLTLVRHDLKKSAIILGSLILLIIVLAILDSKFNLLLKIGDKFFQLFHLQL